MIAALTSPPHWQRGEAPVRSIRSLHRLERHDGPAIEAAAFGRIAVDLDETVAGDAGALVQAVDVLGDQRMETPIRA